MKKYPNNLINGFLEIKALKIVLTLVFMLAGYFMYEYAMAHLMDCFMQEICHRPLLDKLLDIPGFIILTPAYFLAAWVVAILGFNEEGKSIWFAMSMVALIYWYFLSCLAYWFGKGLFEVILKKDFN